MRCWAWLAVTIVAAATRDCNADDVPSDPHSFDDLRNSLRRAGELLQLRNGTPPADRLFISLLAAGRNRRPCCVLRNLVDNVLPTNPADVYVFSLENVIAARVRRNCPELARHAYFMPVEEHWVTPAAAGPRESWLGRYTESYRRMGHWRLVFQPRFARAMGYRYVWQLDDDSHFHQPLAFSVADRLQANNIQIAAHAQSGDPVKVTWGLPELTRYFLVSKLIQPQTLYQHCTPPSIDGLYTVSQTFDGVSLGSEQNLRGGWNRTNLHGNCLILDLEMWMQPDVQEYVWLVVRSGGHFKFRWNEQDVIAMVWQIFVPPSKLDILNIPGYQHPYHQNCYAPAIPV